MILHGLERNIVQILRKYQLILALRKFDNETHQDINPAHLNIHASNFNVLLLFTIVWDLKGQQIGRFTIGFWSDSDWFEL